MLAAKAHHLSLFPNANTNASVNNDSLSPQLDETQVCLRAVVLFRRCLARAQYTQQTYLVGRSAATEAMPDSAALIFTHALSLGKRAAVEEGYAERQQIARALYHRALLLLGHLRSTYARPLPGSPSRIGRATLSDAVLRFAARYRATITE
jgi:hypothetical protein